MGQPKILMEERAEVLSALENRRLSLGALVKLLPGRPHLWRTLMWLRRQGLVLHDPTAFGEFFERTPKGNELLAAHLYREKAQATAKSRQR
ncbi:MAG: hypothetical protein ACXU86_06665 [Archangium sp.]